MAKKKQLNKEEKALENSFEQDEWKSVSKSKQKQMVKSAQSSLKKMHKDIRTNIRLSQADVDLLQKKAEQEGLPYQTLISSIVHKYITDQLVERKVVDELKDTIQKSKKAS